MSAFVVDASVALAWCFDDEATAATRALLDRFVIDGPPRRRDFAADRVTAPLHSLPPFRPLFLREEGAVSLAVDFGKRGGGCWQRIPHERF